MRIHVGTSGYAYKEWKGTFYPPELKADQMLPWYATKLSAVEINNTFYRMPTRKLLAQWGTEVPDGFTFVLKAPQKITHHKNVDEAHAAASAFVDIAQELGPKLGPLLFQLPPYARKNATTLRALLDRVAGKGRVAFEFRHASWNDDEIHALLRERGAALCVAETDDAIVDDATRPVISTADWGYLRLRRTDYTDADLERWAARLRAQPWSEAFVFLKHEDEGKGPRFAVRLRELLA